MGEHSDLISYEELLRQFAELQIIVHDLKERVEALEK